MNFEEKVFKAPPDIADVVKALSENVQIQKKEIRSQANDDWIDETYDINFWDFKKQSYSTILWFQLLMDNTVWDRLALGLGLNGDEIKWCETYYKKGKGPTDEVFDLLKGKLQNLTLGDVLHQVRELNLKDILSRVNWRESINTYRENGLQDIPLKTALNTILKCNQEVSDSFSFRIHQAPEILVNSANLGEVTNETIKSKSKPKEQTKSKNKIKSKFAAKILMIFASDVKEESLRVAQQLKTAQGDRLEIGVMILTAECSPAITEALLNDPGNSIHKWFKQVDFVVPVLSQQFLRQIQGLDSDNTTLDERLYNRYVYRLTLDDFVANMSKNYKCRTLYAPQDNVEIRNSELVRGNGLLQMSWNCTCENEVEQFAEILISGAKDRRRRARF